MAKIRKGGTDVRYKPAVYVRAVQARASAARRARAKKDTKAQDETPRRAASRKS